MKLFLFCCLLAFVAAYRSHRLIKDRSYAVQVHPKHHYQAAKEQQANEAMYSFVYDELEMSGLKLGSFVDHGTGNWITYTGFKKRSRCRKSLKQLATDLKLRETDITKHDEECYEKCNTKHPGSFNLYAECMSSCWYVASGKIASMSTQVFRNPRWTPPTPVSASDYKHFMRYLFNALHRDDRWDVIMRLYEEQQALLKEETWPSSDLVNTQMKGVVKRIKT
eukprot:227182_1